MKINSPKKVKKTHHQSAQLKNFASKTFETKPILWKKREIKIINWLKRRYQFDNNFDLHAHLSHMSIDIMSFKEYDRQIPSIKDTKDTLSLIKKQSMTLEKSLSDKLLNLITESRKHAKILFHMLEITGSKHRTLIAQNTVGNYNTLHQTINLLDILANDDGLFRLRKILEPIISGIDKAQSTLPQPKRGRKEINLEKGIIHKLLHIYTNGTSKEAICNYSRTSGQFYGKFYFFMMTALTLLRQKVKIKVIERNTWGDYARETIKYHYSDRQKNS